MIVAAAKKPTKPKPPPTSEEMWEYVHQHPERVPGGMGKAPEHHLRNRGWNGHEIHGGGNARTIQYHNQQFPDFVISYGGATSQKPNHNFRVLYMGTNTNIPKVHHAYSVAEAMNKVEELHQMQSGLVVQPQTAHQAAATSVLPPTPTMARQPNVSKQKTFVAPASPGALPDANNDPNDPPIGYKPPTFPTKPDKAKDWSGNPKPQVQEIKPVQSPPKAKTTEPKPSVPKAASRRTPDGPATLGRAEYERRQRAARQAHGDRELSAIAQRYGMHIEPEEVPNYRGLRSVVAALQRAELDDWEEAPIQHVSTYDYAPDTRFGLRLDQRPRHVSEQDHADMVDLMHGQGPFEVSDTGYKHLPSGTFLGKSSPGMNNDYFVHNIVGLTGGINQTKPMPFHDALQEFVGRFSTDPSTLKIPGRR